MHNVHDMQDVRSAQIASKGELLTARQVQHILRVDRSTVYRMAEDGRLRAVKIGHQWRFRADEIEDLLEPGHLPQSRSVVDLRDGGAYAVVAMAADLLGVMMLVTDMEGRPLTPVANPCTWFTAHGGDPDTLAACIGEWRALADEIDLQPRFRRGPLGFECARAFARRGTSLVAMVLAGGVAPVGDERPDLYRLDAAGRERVLAALPRVATVLSRSLATDERSRR